MKFRHWLRMTTAIQTLSRFQAFEPKPEELKRLQHVVKDAIARVNVVEARYREMLAMQNAKQ